MDDIPKRIKKQIARYQPVETEGLTLYPIIVDEYEEFSFAKSAIEFMHQSLPLSMVNIPLMQAYFLLDRQSISDEKIPTGLLTRSVLFLALALRIGQGLPVEKRIAMFHPRVGENGKLKSIMFTPDGEEICEITPAMFQRLRPILAAQNGLKIPEEDANPALVEAEEELARQNAPELELSQESLVSSIAALSGVDEKEIYDWPIAKLQNRQRALHRVIDYMICGIGEASGAKWKKGNPVPNPFFDKISGSAAKVALGEFAGGAALNAVREGMRQVKEQ